jgi:hypothetical protein
MKTIKLHDFIINFDHRIVARLIVTYVEYFLKELANRNSDCRLVVS